MSWAIRHVSWQKLGQTRLKISSDYGDDGILKLKQRRVELNARVVPKNGEDAEASQPVETTEPLGSPERLERGRPVVGHGRSGA